MRKRFFSAGLILALLFSFSPWVLAAQADDPVAIYTPEDLAAMGENPEGSYILMADLDMTGIAWKALDFSGSFDGNGHAILNLTITQPGDYVPEILDGNRKTYEAAAYGLFGTLKGAKIQNLSLLNTRAVIECADDCILGGLAGYMENTDITGCSLMGTLELRTGGWMHSIGGLVGYGGGSIRDCSISVTLISVDTDVNAMDEQFLGGVYGAGFIHVYDTTVKIDGYISEHGYVHSGGIVGMFAEYPLGQGQKGYIKNNSVSGKITFFEDNSDRRAYCKAYVGEAMVNRYYLDGNQEDFQREETKEFAAELRPEMCVEPSYVQRVVDPGCQRYGFTLYTCESCGYAYRDHYTPYAHTVTEWKITKLPTLDEEGESTGRCDCGLKFTRTEPKLEPVPTTVPEVTEAADSQTEAPEVPEAPAEEASRFDSVFYVAVGCEAVLLICAAAIIVTLRKRR